MFFFLLHFWYLHLWGKQGARFVLSLFRPFCFHLLHSIFLLFRFSLSSGFSFTLLSDFLGIVRIFSVFNHKFPIGSIEYDYFSSRKCDMSLFCLRLLSDNNGFWVIQWQSEISFIKVDVFTYIHIYTYMVVANDEQLSLSFR